MADLVPQDQFDRLPEKYRRRAREISARVGEIDGLMKPSNPVVIGETVIRMFRQFREQPGVSNADMASEYRAACRDLPEWALSEAANDFLAGRVDNHTGQFMPTCAEFSRRARSIMTPFLAERSSLRTEASKLIDRATDDHKRHLIDMERQDPAVRKRVAGMVEAATAGAPKAQGLTHLGLSEAKQTRIDALKKARQIESKIGHTKRED